MDLLTYNIRDGIRLMQWSNTDAQTFFSPDFMRRQWFLAPVKSYLGINHQRNFIYVQDWSRGNFQSTDQSSSLKRWQRVSTLKSGGRLVFDGQTPTVDNKNGGQ